MKLSKLLVFNLIISFFFIEIGSAFFLRKRLQKLHRPYLDPLYSQIMKEYRVLKGRGYPRFYHINNRKRGFDIALNYPKKFIKKPLEGSPYLTFSNSLGCYDDEFFDKKLDIYLAGDSQTWGYSPYEDQWGTIIDKKTPLLVAKCGVTHTGQLHQFSKFIDITDKLGYFPKIVIVSLMKNDIENDFSHPHTIIIDGYQVNMTKTVLDFKTKKFSRLQMDKATLLRSYDKYKEDLDRELILNNLRDYDPRFFSASLIFFAEIVKKIDKFSKDKKNKKNFKLQKGEIWNAIYGPNKYISKKSYPIKNNFAKKQIEVISNWISHSKDNNYRLIFSNPDMLSSVGYFEPLKKFIIQRKGEFWDFDKYLVTKNIDKKDLRWKFDGHMNIKGNKIYANFLCKNLKSCK